MKRGKIALFFLLFGLFLLFLFSVSVQAQTLGCCISSSGGCQDQKTSAECTSAGGNYFGGQTCASLNKPECTKGCCCQEGSAQVGVEKVKCSSTGQTHYAGITNVVECSQKCNLPAPACPNIDCTTQTAIDYIGCVCGTAKTTAENPWCCKPTNSVHSVQNQCSAPCGGAQKHFIAGTVFEVLLNGQASLLTNAQVTILGGESNITDEQGKWSIAGLSPASYQIQVAKEGYETNISRNIVILDKSLTHNVALKRLEGARVEICDDTAKVDEDGNGYANACDAACNTKKENIKNKASPPYTPADTESVCADGFDNDCDLTVDCLDTDCTADVACKPGGICGDNIRQLPNKDGKFEECDGTDNLLCPGRCQQDCLCPVTCGDLLLHEPPRGNEECDAKYDTNNLKIGGFDLSCPGRCNATSCLCNPLVPVCGNNVREGVEQCDGTDNFACGGFACLPPGEKQCTCKRDFVCGDGRIDVYEDCDLGSATTNICPEAKQCAGNCTCPISCNNDPPAPSLAPLTTQKHQKILKLSWSLEQTACQPNFYYGLRCEGTEQACKQRPREQWEMRATGLHVKTFDDTALAHNINYCYLIAARYDNPQNNRIQDKDSNIQCKTTGDQACYDVATEFCEQKARFACDNDNKKGMVENCTKTKGFECIGPFADGSTTCAFQSPCEECNNPLGAFGLHSSARAPYSQTGLSPTQTICKDIPVCYFDFASTPIDKYYACALVRSCYDYKGKNACTLDAAKCKVGPCAWKASRSEEINGGVCQPAAKEKQDCSRCSSPFNQFLGHCDSNLCSLYGECHYNGVLCKSRKTISCADYKTQKDCAPTKNVLLDVAYTQSVRTSGTHKILAKSDDLFSVGKCRWMEERNQCVKDADGDTQDDCATGDSSCNSDTEPPQTLINPLRVSTGKIRIPFAVVDNVYKGDNMQTFFTVSTQQKYPTTLARNNVFSFDIDDITQSGNYVLTYYSVDDAKNLEEVKTISFYVDTVPPTIRVDVNLTAIELPNDEFRSDLGVTLSVADNVLPEVICSANLTRSGVLVSPVSGTGLRNKPIRQHTLQYTSLVDDLYAFSYECIDRAGNARVGQEKIVVQGDQSITDPQPTGTLATGQNVKLSVVTKEAAACKYSETQQEYDKMEFTFTPEFANNSKHKAFVNVPGLHVIKKYNVKCTFPRTGKIRGNAGDNIHFAVDIVPPKTTVNYAGEFLRGETSFQLTCKDPELLENTLHWEFGCAKTFFCFGLGCNASTEYKGSFTLSSSTPISFYSLDKGGNREALQTVFPKIDGVAPTFQFSILDLIPTLQIVTTVSRIFPPNYVVNITASEPLLNITELFFVYPNGTVSLLNVTLPYPVNIEKTEWHAQMALFGVRNVFAPAQFGILAFDENKVPGISITKGKDFTIDTRIAEPPMLDPPLATYMHPKGGIFYTNKGTPILPGFTRLQQMYVNYYLGIFSDMTKLAHVYHEPETKLVEQPIIEEDAPPGATHVKLRKELPITTTHYAEFLYVNETGGHFRRYPAYKDFYKLANVQKSGGKTLLELSPLLEGPVFQNKMISIYDQERPGNRFTGSLNLTNTFNYLRLNAYQSPFNPTLFTPLFSIFYDYSPPEIIGAYPGEDWTIGNPHQILTVKMRELKAGSGIEAFRVFVNGIKVVEAPQTISDPDNGDYVVQSIAHRDTFSLPRYDVVVFVNDSASNVLSYNYSFFFLANTPDPPVLTIPAGVKRNNKWYVKNTPTQVNLDFSQSVSLKLPLAQNVVDQNTIAGGPLSYTASLLPLNDGEYQFQSEAFLAGQATPGKWNFTFVVDKTSPQFTLQYPLRARAGKGLRITALITHELGDVNGSIALGPYRINDTFVQSQQLFAFPRTAQDQYAFDFVVPATVPHETKIPFSVTLTDILGNKRTEQGEVIIDNLVPGISITKVEADKVVSFTVGDDIFYHIRDNDDVVTLFGQANKVMKLHYFKEKLQPVPLGPNNQFTLQIKLASVEGETIPNFVTFLGQDSETGEEVIFIAKLISDKQPPSPPLILVSNLEAGKVKTPLPSFTVTYNEPVRVLSVGLKEAPSVTFTPKTTDDQTYTFVVKQPLINRQYTFQIRAEDFLGNAQRAPAEEKFVLEANETEIILTKPRHGAATSVPFDLEVVTNRYATCSYAFSATGAFSLFSETGLEQQKLEHRIPGFTQVSLMQATPFYVKCNDGLKENIATFALTVDAKVPQITKAVAEPATITQQPLQSLLKVETDEATVCKFSKTSTNYDQMEFFAGENAQKRTTFRTLHQQLVTLPTVQVGTHTYTINCEDPAGNKAGNKQISFTVVDQELVITIDEPKPLSGDARVILKAKTNKDAECSYTLNSTTQQMQGAQKEHSLDLGILGDGKYDGSATCKSFSDIFGARLQEKTISHSFVVDTSPPVLTAVTVSNASCPDKKNGLYSLTASFSGEDKESGIEGYNYTVATVDKTTFILPDTPSVSSQVFLRNLNFTPGESYIFGVVARNKLNRVSQPLISEPVVVFAAKSPQCLESIPPDVRITTKQIPRGFSVEVICQDPSGCDPATIKYDLSSDTCRPSLTYTGPFDVVESRTVCASACDNLGNCISTPVSTQVTFLDVDLDTIPDWADKCANTPAGDVVDIDGQFIGCSEAQKVKDADSDGVADTLDKCPNTLSGETVDESGCSEAQRTADRDGDGIPDLVDQCPDAAGVAPSGCAPPTADADNDGVPDENDQCPGTAVGSIVDEKGCPAAKPIIPYLFLFFGLLLVTGGGGYLVYKKYYAKPPLPQKEITPDLRNIAALEQQRKLDAQKRYLEEKRHEQIHQRLTEREQERKKLFAGFEKPATRPTAEIKEKITPLPLIKKFTWEKPLLKDIFARLTSLGKEDIFARLHEIVKHDAHQQFKTLEKLPKDDISPQKAFDELAHAAELGEVKPLSYQELREGTHPKIEPEKNLAKQVLSATEKEEVRNNIKKGLAQLQAKEKITQNDILSFITGLPKNERIAVHVTQIILAHLLHDKKISPLDASSLLVELEKKNILFAEDVVDILFALHLR